MADTLNEQAIVKNEAYSVRQFSPNAWGGFVGDAMGFLWPSRADLLPRWGTLECDIALRIMHYSQHNALWSGASKIWIEKLLGTPYEISGGRNLTLQWQDLFFESDFGEGYDTLMMKGLTDYLTLNRGMFIEKVSYGEPDTPIKEGAKILGLNHLDALRIYFTGNREWPYIYQSEWGGGLHRMHYTRIIHLAESPSPDTLWFGMGKSALYDALTVANAQILLGRHQNEMLNDLPPPGIVIFNNVKADEVETAMKQFEYERVRDGQSVYRAPLSLSSKDPSQPATVTFVPMSTVPEGFDYSKYMEVHVNLLALTLQLDPQDIWPLASRAMGSGMQSGILAQKAASKGPGYILTRLTRVWNMVLPRPLEWEYKAQNEAQGKETADIAKVWTDMLKEVTYMSDDEKRQLAANQIPAFADVLQDENGEIRLFDADPKTVEQAIIATDTTQIAPTPAAPDVTANSNTDAVMVDNATQAPPVTKAIDDTESAFISEIQAAMQDGVDRTVTKASTAARIRGAISRYGKLAYQDGLEDGGVDSSDLDDDDLRLIADYNVWDSVYVTDLVNEIYSEAGMSETPETRAPKWVSTLNRYYYGGIASADKNGMYIFTGDDGKENCDTCASLKGVKHRMKWWIENELRPGLDHESFDCGSWPGNCNHYLEKV
jgi:hypothetical protein